MKKIYSIHTIIFLSVFLFATIQPAFAEGSPLPEFPQMPGRVEGTGTHFEITDSEYLNITLDSTEEIHLTLESVPEMVIMDVEYVSGATSTVMTLSGFPASTTFYRYQDDYHNEEAFTTDSGGSYSYTQDISAPHLVFIQPQPSTWFLAPGAGQIPPIGLWDSANRTFVLTTDVDQTIQIDEDNLTLDGDGHKVTGGDTGFWGRSTGVYLPGRTSITIKNLTVQNCVFGIFLYNSSSNTLVNNIACSNTNHGIFLHTSSSNTLENNTASSNTWYGIQIFNSSNNTLTGNIASSNTYYGMFINYYSSNNVLMDNTANSNGYEGIYLFLCSNILTGNTVNSNAHCGIDLNTSSNNMLTGNTVDSNAYGICLTYYSNSNILTGNTASLNSCTGIFLMDSNYNQIYNNNFIGNATQADALLNNSGNAFNLDSPIGGNYWSDHTGTDADGDGFLDFPYSFPGGQDNLPWPHQNGWTGITPLGSNIVVEPQDSTTDGTPATVTFEEVTSPGITTLTTSEQGPPPPSGFKLGKPPTYYEISTTAEFCDTDGDGILVTVCIDYSGVSYGNECMLDLRRHEDTNGDGVSDTWVDRTCSLDTANDIICACVDSLSLFAIFEPNQPPVVGPITAPTGPVEVNANIEASANFTDPDIGDTHTAEWNWDDNTASSGNVTEPTDTDPGSVTGSHIYTTAGVYTLKLTVTDEAGASDEDTFEYVVVYDPSAGFVTGGGWIDSPAGAYAADPDLTGKANFGFVSKHKKGATAPMGNTEFQFRVANLNFHSTAYQWLVVAKHKAMFKGDGTINGEGDYGFLLSAVDAALTNSTDVDLFRIKIWDKNDGDAVAYDNQMNAPDDADPVTAIGGGSIVIHEGLSAAPAKPSRFALLQNYPNSLNPDTWIPYQLAEDADVTIKIYSVSGRLIRTLNLGHQQAGFYVGKSKAAYWDGRNEAGEQVASGIYFYTIQAGEFTATRKMTVAK